LENCHDADDHSCFPFFCKSGFAPRAAALPGPPCGARAAAGRAAAVPSRNRAGPLQSILESIQGPVARIVAVIIIIATGLALAFGDTSGGFRKLIQIVFGLSIAFAASSFFLSFFSFSGGAVV
jgi:type IV secretion system protein TrbC